MPYNRLVRRTAAVFAALILSGCFDPDTSHLTILCDAARPECPDGQSCINNRCTPVGDVPDGGDTADMTLAEGCTSGRGTQLGSAYACPGAFAATFVKQRCAPSWKICTSATGIDLTKCDTLSGFFIADVPGSWTGTMEMCTASNMNPIWFGCGGKQELVRTAMVQCGGFPKSMECRATGWSCNAKQDLNQTENTNASDGVLCCR